MNELILMVLGASCLLNLILAVIAIRLARKRYVETHPNIEGMDTALFAILQAYDPAWKSKYEKWQKVQAGENIFPSMTEDERMELIEELDEGEKQLREELGIPDEEEERTPEKSANLPD
jgi:hypothetical protein